MEETRVRYIVRFMDKDGVVGSEEYCELSEANKTFEGILESNPIFADLDIKTTVNARKFRRE